MKTLIFWQNSPSIHQAPLLSAIACLWPGRVYVVTETDVSEDRLRQGWKRPDFNPAELIVGPSREARKELIRANESDVIHIFSGFHAYPETWWTLKQVARRKAHWGVIVEPVWLSGYRSFLKKYVYRAHALRYRYRMKFLLVTGTTGMNWYQDCGFQQERVFPYGYFVADVDQENRGEMEGNSGDGASSLIYVGILEPRKGLDVLLRALSELRELPWSLSVVGQGVQEKHYRNLCQKLGLADRVIWLGTLPNKESRHRIAQADCLILPSRFDGWGAVVNEALMSGTFVLASDACGASDLLQETWRGQIFPANSVVGLRSALRAVLDAGPVSLQIRERIRTWAMTAIAPTAAAEYFIEVIRYSEMGGSRPVAPWECLLPIG